MNKILLNECEIIETIKVKLFDNNFIIYIEYFKEMHKILY